MKIAELFEVRHPRKPGAATGVGEKKYDLVDYGYGGQVSDPSKTWQGNFHCHLENLTSLKGGPKRVTDDFWGFNNLLKDLKGAPEYVGGECTFNTNKLTSLEGAPKYVHGYFSVSDNKLTSLDEAPEEIFGEFVCNDNKITSLHNIHKHIKYIDTEFCASKNPLKECVLGLLKIRGLKSVDIDNKKVEDIINKYLPLGDIIDCQSELIEAGFDEFAKL
jgi:hypothetical protein